MGYLALLVAAGFSWLLLKGKRAVAMPAIGNTATVQADGSNPGTVAVQFIQKGVGFGFEPFDFSGPQNVRIPIDGNRFWQPGSKRHIPNNADAPVFAWQPGLNMFTQLPED